MWPTVGHQIFAGGPPVDTGFFEARPENHFWPLLVGYSGLERCSVAMTARVEL